MNKYTSIIPLNLFKNVSKLKFIIFFLLLVIVAFISFVVTFGVDDGTTKDSTITRLWQIPLNVLWYPTTVFGDISGPLYVFLLLVQIAFYAIILERIFYFIKVKKSE
jgi:steroid 5-alpha reductase family enzyme